MNATTGERFDDLLDEAEAGLERLEDRSDGGSVEDALRDLRDVLEVVDEIEDVLDAVDLSDLPDAVDERDLVSAVEAGRIPDAVRERDLGAAVDLERVVRAIELGELWDSTDVRTLWREKRELADEVDDISDDGEEEDPVIDELETLLGDDGGDASMLDDGDDDSVLDAVGETVDDAGDSVTDAAADAAEAGGGLADVPSESYQTAIQAKAMEGIDEFRAAVLEAHEKLAALHEENRERMRRQHDETDVSSRNPTAHSTMQVDRQDIGNATQYSTVPRETRYSTAPNRERIYGRRFDRKESDQT